MKKLLFAIAGLAIALAVACSGDTTGPTAAPTVVPTAMPTAIPTPNADPPTPRPAQEWRLENVSVDGSTVTISLFYHSTASVTVMFESPSKSARMNSSCFGEISTRKSGRS